nr:zinc finger protein 804A [Pogona vitticeps]
MECYYIVISSAHLSNGHFRNIKGVFRGPLSKNGNKTLDYAEKENTIAKALEDLKANFYCELCDKQYYKHQEFDNHINSYDHAHKQRLKELKQREFARNVASKSRKDERKQEKALQRLHKLAELRKEAACAPGSGPMFRSTTVMVRDNLNEIPPRTLFDSAEKEQEFNFALLHSSKSTGNVTSVASLSLANNSQPEVNQLGDQMQRLHGHKVAFSFAFPKKASVKLESSAAAFYEYNDEASTEHGLNRRSRFVPGPCTLQVSPAEETVPCLEEKPSSIALLTEKHAHGTVCPPAQDSHESPSQENMAKEVVHLRPSFSHSKSPELGSLDNISINADSVVLPDETPSKVTPGNPDLSAETNSGEHIRNDCTGLPVNEECSSEHDGQEDHDQNISSDSPTAEDEIKKCSSIGQVPTHSEGETVTPPCKQNPHKRPYEPFVPVLNKFGSTILQWPSEMLMYTNTEPSISYSCNPLCFDFRSSRLKEGLEKSKRPFHMPSSSPKPDSSQSSVLDSTDKSLSVTASCATDINVCPCDNVTLVLPDVSSPVSCDPEKNQDALDVGTEKHEALCSSLKCLRESSCAHEQQNKGWVKRTHEKWLHKNRKRKRRRKLCHHHYEEMTEAENDTHPITEQRNVCAVNKHQKLHDAPEQGVAENGVGGPIAELLQPAPETLEGEKGENNGTIAPSSNQQDYQTPHSVWHTKAYSNCCMKANHLWRGNKPVSHRQSSKAGLSSGRQGSAYSRTFCKWNIRRCSSSSVHKHLAPDENQAGNQTQSIKRAYNSLTDEPERSYRKRRHHIPSCSSDDISHTETCLSEDNSRQTYGLAAPCKPKRKRRRKRTRMHLAFIERAYRDLSRRSIHANAPEEVSVANHSPKPLTEGNTEQTKNPTTTDYAGNMERTVQALENETSPQSDCLLSLENTPGSHGSITENTPHVEQLTYSASPVPEHGILAAMEPRNLPKEGEMHENVSAPEIQAPNKVPTLERNLDPPPSKAYLCHYEVAETIPQEKLNPSANEWLRCHPGMFNTPPPLPFKEAHMNSHAFLTTEQILTPFALPDHALLLPPENHDKFKDLPGEAYHQIIQQNMFTSKMKLTFPPAALQPSSAPLPPLSLHQQPLCSTSVTTIHHTVLQQHAAAAAAAAAAASTFKVLQPHQQFLSQVPTLSRTPLPHFSVGPRLCPAGHTALVGPPQLPLIPASVLHPSHLAFSPLPHSLFPSLLSPHPAVIPLQPLF